MFGLDVSNWNLINIQLLLYLWNIRIKVMVTFNHCQGQIYWWQHGLSSWTFGKDFSTHSSRTGRSHVENTFTASNYPFEIFKLFSKLWLVQGWFEPVFSVITTISLASSYIMKWTILFQIYHGENKFYPMRW